jgi:tellurite resistance protein
VNACDDAVDAGQIEALIADLSEQLAEDGLNKRTRMVASTITRRDHQIEVMRIAALMAHISGGVSPQERAVLEQLASGFELGADVVDRSLAEAHALLSAGG